MRTLRLLIVWLNIFLYLLSCNKEDEKMTLTNNYLPLKSGNYWQLDYTDREEIVGTKIINNKTYYLLQYQNDTSYYRIENDKIFVIENNQNESVKFNLRANVNDTWNYNSYKVKLTSKTDIITINGHKIINCYQFFFDVPVMVDEEHSIWLAPGIGFIQEQCGECLHQIRKLDEARIDGQIIHY
jgi:hypothetical protein